MNARQNLALMDMTGINEKPLSQAHEFIESEFDTSKAREYQGILGSLVGLMNALVDQSSDSYRSKSNS